MYGALDFVDVMLLIEGRAHLDGVPTDGVGLQVCRKREEVVCARVVSVSKGSFPYESSRTSDLDALELGTALRSDHVEPSTEVCRIRIMDDCSEVIAAVVDGQSLLSD